MFLLTTLVLFRYEHLWLPLASRHGDKLLTAPIDVQWAWHCHMLAPLHYVRDCQIVCGSTVDHSLTPTWDEARTEELWTEAYPDHPYRVDITREEPYIDTSNIPSKLGYNLEEAAARQKVFYYQVSLPHYQDDQFIENGIQRYRKFLELKQCYPENFIVPCYDVDVVWHAHQVHPVAYKRDTEILLGKHFNHDDSVNDRSPGSKLNTSDADTRVIWKEKYGENFSCFGAMYRGLPPNGKLTQTPNDLAFKGCTKEVVVNIISAEMVDFTGSSKISLSFELHLANMRMTMLKMKHPVKGIWDRNTHQGEKWEFDFDSGMCKYGSVLLHKYGILGSKQFVSDAILDVQSITEACMAVGRPERRTMTLIFNNNSVLDLTMDIKVTKMGDLRYAFDRGSFEECIIPEFIEDLWGPVPLPRLPQGQDNKCSVANHR